MGVGEDSEGELLARYLDVRSVRRGEHEDGDVVRAALVELSGGVEVSGAVSEGRGDSAAGG